MAAGQGRRALPRALPRAPRRHGRLTRARDRPPARVIAGGGVGALEALLALAELGDGRLELTLVAPEDDFTLRALSVGEPFGVAHAPRLSLAAVAAEHGARFVRDRVVAVLPQERRVRTGDGGTFGYDALLLALGARPRPAFPDALTFRGSQDAPALGALVTRLVRDAACAAFVVPPGTGWPLPLYELAVLTARRAPGARLALVTPEPAPLALLGERASEAVAGLLDEAGVTLRLGAEAEVLDAGRRVRAGAAGDDLVVDHVVALPRLEGPRPRGVPTDAAGFLPVDGHGRVRGTTDVFAAGDATDYPVKQGGLAAQQADAAARCIAARAGLGVEATPFRPVLRGRLLGGDGSHALGEDADGALWQPETKVFGDYLAPWLAGWERARGAPPRAGRPVERHLAASSDPAVLGLAPYAPRR